MIGTGFVFRGEWCFENMTSMLGVLIATEALLLSVLLSEQSRENASTHTHVKPCLSLIGPLVVQRDKVLQGPPFHTCTSLVHEKPGSFNPQWVIHLLHPLYRPVL